jgi:hypothetical protein
MSVMTAEMVPPKCARAGCDSPRMRGCSYVDRKGNNCITQWCMDHVKVVSGVAYCPRHAGVMNAIARSSSPDERPLVKCRAPSLTAWFADILDPKIDALVSRLGDAGYGPQLVRQGLSHRLGNLPAHHHWEQGWQVQIPGQRPLEIVVDVKEEIDIVVRVLVNEVLITRIVPPWIERHQNLSGKGDEDRVREEFCELIVTLIGQSLEVNISGPAASNWLSIRADKFNVV